MAELFPSCRADFFSSIAITTTPVFWSLVQSFRSQRSGMESKCTHRATAELRFYSAFGKQVWPTAGNRVGRAAKVANLSRSLSWLVKCTRQDPQVLIHTGTKGKRRGRAEILEAKSRHLKNNKASMAVVWEVFTVLCAGLERQAKKQSCNVQQKRW